VRIYRTKIEERKEIKMDLDTSLKIVKIDDGEEYFIVVKSTEDAKKYYLKEMNFENIQEDDLEVREIQKDEDIQINLNGDDDLLLELINRYRRADKRLETINIWDLLKYNILELKLQDKELEIPCVISSSTY